MYHIFFPIINLFLLKVPSINDGARTRSLAPFSVRRITVTPADVITGSLWAVARATEVAEHGLVGDVCVMTASGQALVTVEGLRCRDTQSGDAAVALATTLAAEYDCLYETEWIALKDLNEAAALTGSAGSDACVASLCGARVGFPL